MTNPRKTVDNKRNLSFMEFIFFKNLNLQHYHHIFIYRIPGISSLFIRILRCGSGSLFVKVLSNDIHNRYSSVKAAPVFIFQILAFYSGMGIVLNGGVGVWPINISLNKSKSFWMLYRESFFNSCLSKSYSSLPTMFCPICNYWNAFLSRVRA